MNSTMTFKADDPEATPDELVSVTVGAGLTVTRTANTEGLSDSRLAARWIAHGVMGDGRTFAVRRRGCEVVELVPAEGGSYLFGRDGVVWAVFLADQQAWLLSNEGLAAAYGTTPEEVGRLFEEHCDAFTPGESFTVRIEPAGGET